MMESASSMAMGRTSARALILAVLYSVSPWAVSRQVAGDVHLLDLVVGHGQAQLADTRLDGVPARQARGEVDVAREAKVLGVEDLVRRRVVEDGLGVNAGLVGEGAEARDGVVEGRVDLDGLGDEVLNLRARQHRRDRGVAHGAGRGGAGPGRERVRSTGHSPP